MQTSRLLEIWVGLFIALGLMALLFLALQVSNLADFTPDEKSYRLTARFENVGALRVRAPVSIAGVTIGRVTAITYDQQNYQAVVEMHIEPAYSHLPTDTSASILTSGLLGEQYLGLTPGGSEDSLQDGNQIELTQSAFVLEQMISRFLFSKAEGEAGSQKKDAEAAKE
ncbi:MAG: outer membrane lipid asymmetry maintenance protein MlaD [Methylococcaceae bacterium]